IFDGNMPHTPKGCVAQAWSVAELLRCYVEEIKGQKPTFIV
ncbi:MAG: amylo-alpha-1,6-glucosidase, partial [Candidatus Riflebacteria bacterium]